MACFRVKGLDRRMRIDEVNAHEDERLRRALDVALPVLGAPAGFAFGFASFGSALWANIYVDGHDNATFAEVLSAVGPLAAVLASPAIVLAIIAARRGQQVARWTIAAGAVVPMQILGPYALGAFAAGAFASSTWRSIRGSRVRPPAVDATVLLAGLGLMILWCVLEARR